jgi:hypothetical protein
MGKKNTEAPDYAPLENASNNAAEVQAKMGREQLAFAREQYDTARPMLEGIANQQMAAQSQQMAQAKAGILKGCKAFGMWSTDLLTW